MKSVTTVVHSIHIHIVTQAKSIYKHMTQGITAHVGKLHNRKLPSQHAQQDVHTIYIYSIFHTFNIFMKLSVESNQTPDRQQLHFQINIQSKCFHFLQYINTNTMTLTFFTVSPHNTPELVDTCRYLRLSIPVTE